MLRPSKRLAMFSLNESDRFFSLSFFKNIRFIIYTKKRKESSNKLLEKGKFSFSFVLERETYFKL